jgi:hypothetical protein
MTVHSGEAVVEAARAAAGMTISVTGDAVNMARHLNSVAAPGRITMTAAVHQRVGLYFECVSLGYQRLRGSSHPIELFEVLHEAASRNRVELVDPGNLTPLIGRDTELNILRTRWEQTEELLLRWLRRLVERNPVLFIVEDLHWVDPSTLALVEV